MSRNCDLTRTVSKGVWPSSSELTVFSEGRMARIRLLAENREALRTAAHSILNQNSSRPLGFARISRYSYLLALTMRRRVNNSISAFASVNADFDTRVQNASIESVMSGRMNSIESRFLSLGRVDTLSLLGVPGLVANEPSAFAYQRSLYSENRRASPYFSGSLARRSFTWATIFVHSCTADSAEVTDASC